MAFAAIALSALILAATLLFMEEAVWWSVLVVIAPFVALLPSKRSLLFTKIMRKMFRKTWMKQGFYNYWNLYILFE